MRRQILEREHVACRQAHDGIGIGCTGQFTKSAQHRKKIFGRAVIRHHQHEWALSNASQEDGDQRLRRGGQSSDTYPPRALA